MDNLAQYNLSYLSLLIFLNVVIAVGVTLLMVGILIRPYKPIPRKMMPYESGVPPIGKARERYSIRFYIIAMLFVLFDIESVFLYPWAINFTGFVARGQGVFILIEMLSFIVIILFGYAYAWRKGALDWVS